MSVCSCLHPYISVDFRGRHKAPSSITLCLISSRWKLLLNLELGWQPEVSMIHRARATGVCYHTGIVHGDWGFKGFQACATSAHTY